MKSIKPILYLLLFFSFTSCNTEPRKNIEIRSASTIKHAKGFDIVKVGNQTNLIIKTPYPGAEKETTYKIVSKKSSDKNTIKTPLNSIVVTSTTHIPVLELLNVENKLVGFPNTNFVSSPKTRKLIAQNLVKELGHTEHINTEALLDLNPELVIGFSLNSNNKMYATIKKMGIPVVLSGAWLEETPLGRAEWIKMFGVLFNKEKQADSIFNKIESDYLKAKEIAKNVKYKPTIVCGGLYKDVWYLPAGNSFEATFLNHANTNYLWKNTEGKGSLSLNVESVFEKGKDADIWLSPGFYKSLNDLEKDNLISSKMNAYATKKVYSYSNTLGESGGIWYFELAPTRPDLVLKDLIKIAHPKLLPNYNFTFYKNLN